MEQDVASDENLIFDGCIRFWSKAAVLGVYWTAEKVDERSVRNQMTDDIELERFEAPLSFAPDSEFKYEWLSQCQWEEVVRQISPDESSGQLSLFDGVEDE